VSTHQVPEADAYTPLGLKPAARFARTITDVAEGETRRRKLKHAEEMRITPKTG
jgi:hypothetical protein